MPNLRLVTLDFETYFDTHYTLKKMDIPSYVSDDRFLLHGVGIDKKYYPRTKLRKALNDIDWDNTALLCHNTMFDAFILSHHFNIVPAYYYDTLSMARPFFMNERGVALDVVAKALGFEGKTSNILLRTKGKRELTAAEAKEMGDYCRQDVAETLKVFTALSIGFPQFELDLIDMTIRMFADPRIQVDVPRITKEIESIKHEKQRMFESVREILPDPEADPIKVLRSAPKFAEAIAFNGAEPPTKVSPTTGKTTFAFAKTDLGFQELATNPDPRIQLLYKARLESKSDTALNKAQTLLNYSELRGVPIHLNYWKATTGRWSGGGLQPQNMNRGGEVRRSLIAPPGHVIAVVDSGQIECRLTAWLAGQESILDVFRDNGDIYKVMASKIYKKPVEEINKNERFLGKCVAEGSLILTDKGEIPIEQITTCHRVWDGIEWVQHEGLVYKGEQEVIEYEEIIGTPEHVVYLHDGTRATLEYAKANNSKIAKTGNGRKAIRLGKDFIESNTKKRKKELHPCQSTMPRMQGNKMDKRRKLTTRYNKRLSAMQPAKTSTTMAESSYRIDTAEMQQPQRQTISQLRRPRNTVQFQIPDRCSAMDPNKLRSAQRYGDRSHRQQWTLRTRESSVRDTQTTDYEHAPNKTISKRQDMGKTIQSIHRVVDSTVHERRSNKAKYTRQSELSSNTETKELETDTKKARVYDIINAGPRNRFTCHNLLLSNCAILGLGYGMSAKRFQLILAQGALGPPVDLELKKCEEVVKVYRSENNFIANLWRVAGNWLEVMAAPVGEFKVPEYLGLTFSKERIHTHKGMSIYYPNLRPDEEGYSGSYLYDSVHSAGKVRGLYGAQFVENIVQHIARNLIAEQSLNIAKKYPPVLLVHDEFVTIVPEKEADEAYKFMVDCFTTPPDWCPDLPLSADGGYSAEYSK